MIFYIPNIKFTDNEWLYILIQYLNGWTEIPLNVNNGYNINELKFYDGFIGLLLKQTEFFLQECNSSLDNHFVESWKYKGPLYRVIHATLQEDKTSEDGFSYKMPQVEYHGMISHWTDDYTFSGLMHKLNPNEKYIILEADTKEHIGFDINKFRKEYHCENHFTDREREIIFPMYKECIKEYHMSINEFKHLKENK